jgi:hypothetical protein
MQPLLGEYTLVTKQDLLKNQQVWAEALTLLRKTGKLGRNSLDTLKQILKGTAVVLVIRTLINTVAD